MGDGPDRIARVGEEAVGQLELGRPAPDDRVGCWSISPAAVIACNGYRPSSPASTRAIASTSLPSHEAAKRRRSHLAEAVVLQQRCAGAPGQREERAPRGGDRGAKRFDVAAVERVLEAPDGRQLGARRPLALEVGEELDVAEALAPRAPRRRARLLSRRRAAGHHHERQRRRLLRLDLGLPAAEGRDLASTSSKGSPEWSTRSDRLNPHLR